MSDDTNHGLALLANGSAGRWSFSIDESDDHENAWCIEIENEQVYLVFSLRDLAVISEVIDFLRGQGHCNSKPAPHNRTENDYSIILGKFAGADVSLRWDNEDFARCFLVLGEGGLSTLHLSLDEQDIRMWIDALGQVQADLSPTLGAKQGTS